MLTSLISVCRGFSAVLGVISLESISYVLLDNELQTSNTGKNKIIA